jgi:hypothetical protein
MLINIRLQHLLSNFFRLRIHNFVLCAACRMKVNYPPGKYIPRYRMDKKVWGFLRTIHMPVMGLELTSSS